ncbi:hypothetical protein ABPG75_008314 [Micractinium tetrahymenae]
MQRLVGRLSLPVGAVAAGATVRAQQPVQHGPGSPMAEHSTRLSMEEQDGFMHVGLQAQPVQQHEVTQAISQLAALGGVDVEQRRPASAAAPTPRSTTPAPAGPVSSGPLIEEIDAESEASSEGTAANMLLASAEFEPYGAGAAVVLEQEEPSQLDLLSASITNLLNNPEVMSAIEGALVQDPAFVQLVSRQAPGVALPAPARMLLLEEVTSANEQELCGALAGLSGEVSGNILVDLLHGISRGTAAVAVHIGEAFCHLGNFLRGLGENLRTALSGVDGSPAAAAGAGVDNPRARSVERAVFKVALVVAVFVITRRVVAVPRPVVA